MRGCTVWSEDRYSRTRSHPACDPRTRQQQAEIVKLHLWRSYSRRITKANYHSQDVGLETSRLTRGY